MLDQHKNDSNKSLPCILDVASQIATTFVMKTTAGEVQARDLAKPNTSMSRAGGADPPRLLLEEAAGSLPGRSVSLERAGATTMRIW